MGIAVVEFTEVPLAIFGRFLPDRSGSGDRYQLEGTDNSGPRR
jgi:hypothetical protein